MIAAGNRNNCIEDRDVNDRHRPARARGSVLFTEDPRFTDR